MIPLLKKNQSPIVSSVAEATELEKYDNMTYNYSNSQKSTILNKKVEKWAEVDTRYMNQHIHTL